MEVEIYETELGPWLFKYRVGLRNYVVHAILNRGVSKSIAECFYTSPGHLSCNLCTHELHGRKRVLPWAKKLLDTFDVCSVSNATTT